MTVVYNVPSAFKTIFIYRLFSSRFFRNFLLFRERNRKTRSRRNHRILSKTSARFSQKKYEIPNKPDACLVNPLSDIVFMNTDITMYRNVQHNFSVENIRHSN